MKRKIIRSQTGLTIIELIIAMFIVSIVLLAVIRAFAASVSMVNSASHNTIALSLAQEALERIRYERDRYVRNNAITGWQEFYTNFAFIEQTQEASITMNADGTLLDIDPCDGTKKMRYINQTHVSEENKIYKAISTTENQGKLVIFSDEDDREKILLFSGIGEETEPITFRRQILCKKRGAEHTRASATDVLEFIVQVDWEFQGVEYAMPLKMELANWEK